MGCDPPECGSGPCEKESRSTPLSIVRALCIEGMARKENPVVSACGTGLGLCGKASRRRDVEKAGAVSADKGVLRICYSRAGHAALLPLGNWIQKRLPTFGCDSTPLLPPRRSIALETMARPTP